MITRYCPHCNADLRDENIYEHFLNRYTKEGRDNPESEAKVAASMYGGDGYFWKTINIYSLEKDRTVSTICPNCRGEV